MSAYKLPNDTDIFSIDFIRNPGMIYIATTEQEKLAPCDGRTYSFYKELPVAKDSLTISSQFESILKKLPFEIRSVLVLFPDGQYHIYNHSPTMIH